MKWITVTKVQAQEALTRVIGELKGVATQE